MLRVIGGECTATFDEGDDDDPDERHGRLVCLLKPDDTVLVHAVGGYRPVAWLTRADAVTVAGDPPTVTAAAGDRTLRVVCHDATLDRELPVSAAGRRLGPCPDCRGTLVRTGDAVACTDCETRHGLPTGATVGDERCDCGLPRMTVARGERFDLCVDRTCEPLDAAVAAAFDRAWGCPADDCDADLRVVRAGGLLAGCDRYPDCDAAFRLPDGVVDGTCGCGLPAFETGEGRRCLDATCGAVAADPGRA